MKDLFERIRTHKKVVAIAGGIILLIILLVGLLIWSPWKQDKEVTAIPTDIVENELVQVYIGEQEENFSLGIRSEVELNTDNLSDYVTLNIEYGKHSDDTPIELSVTKEKDGYFRLTGNYAAPGSYAIILKSDEVIVNEEDDVAEQWGVTDQAREISFDLAAETYEHIEYQEAVKEAEAGKIYACNGSYLCAAETLNYQVGDIVLLEVNGKEDYYKITKQVDKQAAANSGIDIPEYATATSYYEIRLAELNEVFTEMEAYLNEALSQEELQANSAYIEEEFRTQLTENEYLDELTEMMLTGSTYTEGYQTLSAKELGYVAKPTSAIKESSNGVSLKIDAGAKNKEYAEEMRVPADTEFFKVTATVQRQIELTNSSGKGITVTADVTFVFWVHVHVGGYAEMDGLELEFDAHAVTFTHTDVALNLVVATTNNSDVINITDEFKEILRNASSYSEALTEDGLTFFEVYSGIIGDTESERVVLCETTIAEPIYVVGVVQASFPIDLVVSVDMHAALSAELDVMTGHKVGLAGNTFDGVYAYAKNYTPSVRFNFQMQGHADVRAGLRAGISVGFTGFARWGNVTLSAEVGPYIDLYGFYYMNYYDHGRNGSFGMGGAYYMTTGIYLDIDISATVLKYKFKADLVDEEWVLATIGTKEVLYGFAYNDAEPIVMDTNALCLDDYGILDVYYYDLTGPESEDNPRKATLADTEPLRVSISDPAFKYDADTRTIYYSGICEVETVDAIVTIEYYNSQASFSGSIKLKVPIRYWNNDVLGEYDKDKIGTKCTVSYMYEGEVYKTEEVEYGTRLYNSGKWIYFVNRPNTKYEAIRWIHNNPVIVEDVVFDHAEAKPLMVPYHFQYIDEFGEKQMAYLSAPYGEYPNMEEVAALTTKNPGLQFIGWYTYCSTELSPIKLHYEIIPRYVYRAHYRVMESVTVNFDVGDGVLYNNLAQVVEDTTVKIYFDERASQTALLPYRALSNDENKQFVGFMMDGQMYTEGAYIPVVNGQELHMTAVYENKEHEISLVTDEGTQKVYRNTAENLTLPTPTKGDKAFIGWLSEKDGSYYTDTYYVTGADTLRAVFEGDPVGTYYTVTFDLSGGKLSDGRTSVTVQVKEGEYAPYIGIPTLDKNDGKKYEFVKWTPDFSEPITKDTTFKAVFEEVIYEDIPAGPVVTGVHHKVENGVLTIYGTGKIGNYLVDEPGQNIRPWDSDYKSITKLVIEDGITYIGNHAFSYLTNLQSVEIADSVKGAGFACFMGCTKLTSVKFSKNMINTVDEDAYASMFTDCVSLKTITLPAGWTVIPMQMFHSCSALETVNLPNTIHTISDGAFINCTSLKNISINQNMNIAENAFWGCENLSYDWIETAIY